FRLAESAKLGEFTWGKFLSSGEVADGGAGFAEVDNLAFDDEGNLWFVCDITTEVYNHPVDRHGKSAPGQKEFPGIFGNSAGFVVATSGPDAGLARPFMIGPMECELTGIKFFEDKAVGNLLLVSVQHPGEWRGVGKGETEQRNFTLRTRRGR